VELVRRLFANWPLKLTSVLLALLLWVIATLEEPVTRRVRARIELDPPADRTVTVALATASVQLTAPAREFLKLGTRQVTLAKVLLDSTEGSHTLSLTPADVVLPRGISARALDVQPGEVSYRMVARSGSEIRSRSWHGVPVAVPGPSGSRWLAVPDTVTVVVRAPAARLAGLDLDSIVVIARPDTSTGAASLRAIAPPGVTAEVRPQAIRLQARAP
jgi:hypothetical protein